MPRKLEKLSNKEFVELVKKEYERLGSPTKSEFTYNCMVTYDWNRTLAMEAIGMFEIVEKVKFAEPKTEKENELEEFKQILGFEDEKEIKFALQRLSEEDKQWLREWHKYVNSPEARKRREKAEDKS